MSIAGLGHQRSSPAFPTGLGPRGGFVAILAPERPWSHPLREGATRHRGDPHASMARTFGRSPLAFVDLHPLYLAERPPDRTICKEAAPARRRRCQAAAHRHSADIRVRRGGGQLCETRPVIRRAHSGDSSQRAASWVPHDALHPPGILPQARPSAMGKLQDPEQRSRVSGAAGNSLLAPCHLSIWQETFYSRLLVAYQPVLTLVLTSNSGT